MKQVAVIYDLDETILPTSKIPATTFEPIFNAIRQANNNHIAELLLQDAFDELWKKPFDIVARAYHFTDAMINAGKHALINTDYQLAILPFDDFNQIKEIEGIRILVTTGITKLQQAKINALFKDGDFDAIIIDDPFHDNRLGKKAIFAQLAVQYQLNPKQVWIVGDSLDSEIAAGNELGMNTVQITRSEAPKTFVANHNISSFYELKRLIDSVSSL